MTEYDTSQVTGKVSMMRIVTRALADLVIAVSFASPYPDDGNYRGKNLGCDRYRYR